MKKTIAMVTLQRLLRLVMVMVEIKVPSDRDASYNPMIIPIRKSVFEGLGHIIVSLCVKGMSVFDIEEQIKEVCNFDVFGAQILV